MIENKNKKEIMHKGLQKKKLISIVSVSIVVLLCINNNMVNTGICLNTFPNQEATILEQQHREIMIKLCFTTNKSDYRVRETIFITTDQKA